MHSVHFDEVNTKKHWEDVLQQKGTCTAEVIETWLKGIQYRKGAKRSQLRLPKKIAERLGVAPDVVLEGGILRTASGQELWRRS